MHQIGRPGKARQPSDVRTASATSQRSTLRRDATPGPSASSPASIDGTDVYAPDRTPRQGPPTLGRENGLSYVAAIDPATRRNAWTLCVVARKYRRDGRLCT